MKGSKFNELLKELSKITVLLEQLVIRIISLIGWVLIHIKMLGL